MRFHPYGEEQKPVVIMLPGSFCNADTMANIITKLEIEFRILAVDYNGQYAGSERPFTSRSGDLITKTRFFQYYIPETKGCAGYHSFGYNRKEQLKQILTLPFAALLTTWVCTLF